MNTPSRKLPSPWLSLVPILVLIGLLYVTIRSFGSGALTGGSQMVLLTATAVTSLLAISFCKVKWKEIEETIRKNIYGIAAALIILLLIGALAGTWMISGIVPTMIYYGMQVLHPSFFLATCCVICSVVSVMTGSSWTTIATIGIALMGIGQAQGFSEGWVAGAIISGAYFGDKVSPLSDTTVLASSVTNTPLFTHIRYMAYTTVPSVLITLLIFTVVGLNHETQSTTKIAEFSASLQETFCITPWLLIVPLITAFLIARKVPSLVTLFSSALMASIVALIFQPDILLEVADTTADRAQALYMGVAKSFYASTSIDTGNEALNRLVSTRGMSGMLNTIWLILCAMCFGGAMQASGMLESLTSVLRRFMKKGIGMVTSNVFSGLFLNFVTGDQFMSIILTVNMYKDIYRKNGYESRLLSRTTEDSVTATSVLVPWSTCGMTQSTVLGVATLTYLPYCFFNLLSPLMSILVMLIGYKIKRIPPQNDEEVVAA